jgi:hypothetical protein
MGHKACTKISWKPFSRRIRKKTWAATGQKTENGVNPIETFMYKFPNFLKN